MFVACLLPFVLPVFLWATADKSVGAFREFEGGWVKGWLWSSFLCIFGPFGWVCGKVFVEVVYRFLIVFPLCFFLCF